MAEMKGELCCGAVAGGIKFCTLGAQVSSFTTHSKKVAVVVNHPYVTMPRNNAYSNHHAPVEMLGDDQLSLLLQERHGLEEWAKILHMMQPHMMREKVGGLSFILGRKHKEWYAGLAVVQEFNTLERKETLPRGRNMR
jgi:hypothetical protein